MHTSVYLYIGKLIPGIPNSVRIVLWHWKHLDKKLNFNFKIGKQVNLLLLIDTGDLKSTFASYSMIRAIYSLSSG